jgi:hypothetical protein
LPLEEFRPPVERLSFGEGERPIAFGQLLDTPAQESAASGSGLVEPVDDEQILTSSRDASLGDPIFWKTEEPKEEAEEDQDIRPSSASLEAGWKMARGSRLQPAKIARESFELVVKKQMKGRTGTRL